MKSDVMSEDLQKIFSTKTIREKCHQILGLALMGKTQFEVDMSKLDEVAKYVLEVIRDNYPDLNIPFHSRKNHLNAGSVPRTEQLTQAVLKQNPQASKFDIGKAQFELVVVSVLLDAGAGDSWSFKEERSGTIYSRSEGLAVASFEMFMKGAFSSDPANPFQVDAKALQTLQETYLRKYFQVRDDNPLLGVSGRVRLLNSLGRLLAQNLSLYPQGRLGGAFDYLCQGQKNISALTVLDFVLRQWGEIWPSRLRLQGKNLGDVWAYSGFGKKDDVSSLVPFHKLSQWLTYSLLVPIMEAGISVKDVELMTGLPEYRNGGLMIDLGFIRLRNKEMLLKKHHPEEDLIIEWRALTVALLDKIGERVQQLLKMSPQDLPLAKVLEGGTWHAGRKIAKQLRPGGVPPLNIESDGTVF